MPYSLRAMPLPLSPVFDRPAPATPPRRPFSDYPRRVALTLNDAARVMRLIDAVPDTQGRPFLILSDAAALAFDIAANVVAASALERFRTPPPPPLPLPELSVASSAWL